MKKKVVSFISTKKIVKHVNFYSFRFKNQNFALTKENISWPCVPISPPLRNYAYRSLPRNNYGLHKFPRKKKLSFKREKKNAIGFHMVQIQDKTMKWLLKDTKDQIYIHSNIKFTFMSPTIFN